MSRTIETNVIKEEFDGVLETPLAEFPFDFDVSSESAHELQAGEVHCSTSNTATASNNSSSQLPGENGDQNYATKSNTPSNESMTEDGVGEDIATDKDRDDQGAQHYCIKIIELNCTEKDCFFRVPNRDKLNDHLLSAHGKTPFRCLAIGCTEQFQQFHLLGNHVLHQHSNMSSWHCSFCDKPFGNQNQLYHHLDLYHHEGRFQCGVKCCKYKRVETRRSEIRRHQLASHSTKKVHICDTCSKPFNRLDNLKSHKLTHTGVKPYKCDTCGKQFSNKSNLNAHKRTHNK